MTLFQRLLVLLFAVTTMSSTAWGQAASPRLTDLRPGDEKTPSLQPHGCAQACHEQAEQVFQKCIEQGGTPEECEAVAHDFLEQCIREHCEPPPCVRMCNELAAQVYHECIEGGGEREECEAAAQEARENCIQQHCG